MSSPPKELNFKVVSVTHPNLVASGTPIKSITTIAAPQQEQKQPQELLKPQDTPNTFDDALSTEPLSPSAPAKTMQITGITTTPAPKAAPQTVVWQRTPTGNVVLGPAETTPVPKSQQYISQQNAEKKAQPTFPGQILPARMKEGMKDLSITESLFDFNPAKSGAELGASLFGVTGEKKEKLVKQSTDIVTGISQQASKPIKSYPKFLAGIVGSVESYWNPRIQTTTGAILGDASSIVFGTKGGNIAALEQDWGEDYMAGSLAGDVLQSIVIGKGISAARKTKVG